MAESFSLALSRCAVINDPGLRNEIQARTDNAEATTRILSAIGRFGGDPSILRFEVTPQAHRGYPSANRVAWSVRAVRPQVESPPLPAVTEQ